jgi:hypothetical protein
MINFLQKRMIRVTLIPSVPFYQLVLGNMLLHPVLLILPVRKRSTRCDEVDLSELRTKLVFYHLLLTILRSSTLLAEKNSHEPLPVQGIVNFLSKPTSIYRHNKATAAKSSFLLALLLLSFVITGVEAFPSITLRLCPRLSPSLRFRDMRRTSSLKAVAATRIAWQLINGNPESKKDTDRQNGYSSAEIVSLDFFLIFELNSVLILLLSTEV